MKRIILTQCFKSIKRNENFNQPDESLEIMESMSNN